MCSCDLGGNRFQRRSQRRKLCSVPGKTRRLNDVGMKPPFRNSTTTVSLGRIYAQRITKQSRKSSGMAMPLAFFATGRELRAERKKLPRE